MHDVVGNARRVVYGAIPTCVEFFEEVAQDENPGKQTACYPCHGGRDAIEWPFEKGLIHVESNPDNQSTFCFLEEDAGYFSQEAIDQHVYVVGPFTCTFAGVA